MVNQKAYCGKDPIAKKASAARGDKKGKKCRAMRTDGAYVEAGEQDNLTRNFRKIKMRSAPILTRTVIHYRALLSMAHRQILS